MRQARLALGKEAERIERVWILGDAMAPDPDLLRVDRGLIVARAHGTFLAELPSSGNPAEYIYVAARKPDAAFPERAGRAQNAERPRAPAAGLASRIGP
jgi:hypothetical protein